VDEDKETPSASGKEWPADIADRLERLSDEEAREVLRQLPAAEAAMVLAEMHPGLAAAVLDDVDAKAIADWVRHLPPHMAADLVFALPAERREGVLAGLPPELAQATSALLRYPPDTAGGIMDNRFIAVRADATADECLAQLRGVSPRRVGEPAYVYVTDEAKRLVGVIIVRDLVFSPGETRVGELMNREVERLRVTDDQEEIARQLQRHEFAALPVVDESGRLVGVVKMSDALRIAEDEATEDMQLMVGLSGEERIWTSWKISVAKRLPWLGVNLATALGASAVVSLFEDTISRWTALVVFLPLISAVAGNAGNQALTVIIRGFALGELKTGDALRAVRKELAVGLVNGFALGVAIGLIGFGWKGSLMLGMVAGVAMLVNQLIGALSGVFVPFGLRSCRVDPALASSIFVTTLTDMAGFLVFLALAAAALRIVGM
jgi:magnesium transporter